MHVRPAALADLDALCALRLALWPDAGAGDRASARAILEGRPESSLPLVMFVAEDAGRVVGFVEVGLRSHADGCDGSRPVGFLEGWYVVPDRRGTGVGRALVERAEAWARGEGALEMASDTWLDSEGSQRAHAALGFEVVDRCVHFMKRLVPPHYGADLARLHHAHFGMVAEGAAGELLARVRGRTGTVVDLAAGSGILSRRVADAGFDVLGVDLSADMLAIARANVPAARFVRASLWDVAIPPCVAVAAVGEAFSYAADPRADLAALEARLASIAAALAPGGVLIFDVASPGRSGATGERRVESTHDGVALSMHEREREGALARTLVLALPDGRRVEEHHALRLYAPADVEGALERAGFAWERLHRYGAFTLSPGWTAFCATARPARTP